MMLAATSAITTKPDAATPRGYMRNTFTLSTWLPI
jgi:hypothetical protein